LVQLWIVMKLTKRETKHYQAELDKAAEILNKNGISGTFEWSPYDYELFIFKSEDVQLLFYRYRNGCVRVRAHASKDKVKAKAIMMLLYRKGDFWQRNNWHNCQEQEKLAHKARHVKFGEGE
jgi:hypothetical protein